MRSEVMTWSCFPSSTADPSLLFAVRGFEFPGTVDRTPREEFRNWEKQEGPVTRQGLDKNQLCADTDYFPLYVRGEPTPPQ